MDARREQGGGYVVPSYRAPDDTAWYHFLHGNVPRHQIDFIYRPDVPQGALSRQHFSHLSRLMKYIEPQTNGVFAFAIGNLSRDDTQYEPGHGGVALIFGLRIHGVTDHAGRQDPPFAHAIAAVDRALDHATLLDAATVFHRHVLERAESESWYRKYVGAAQEGPSPVPGLIEGYVGKFGDLPRPVASTLSGTWITRGAVQPKRIVIVHDDATPFAEIASMAARIAALLYRSDIRWTVISNGREDDVPNGVSVRLLAKSNLSATDTAGMTLDLAKLPKDEAGLAKLLFGAVPVDVGGEKPAAGWRDRYSAAEPSPQEESTRRPSWEGQALRRGRRRDPATGEEISVDVEVEEERPSSAAHAPVRGPVPRSVPPPSIAGTSEPPGSSREALTEIPIPAAPRVPVVLEPASVSPAELASSGSSRKFWLYVVGFCAVAVPLAVYFATRNNDVAPVSPLRLAASETASALPVASLTPPKPSATAVVALPPTVNAPLPEATVASLPATVDPPKVVLTRPTKVAPRIPKPEVTAVPTHEPVTPPDVPPTAVPTVKPSAAPTVKPSATASSPVFDAPLQKSP